MPFDPSNPESTTGMVYPTWNARGPVRNWLQRVETGAPRIQGGQIRPTAGQYSRIPISSLRKVGVNDFLDLTSPTIKKIGSLPPAANTYGFSYTSTATSITWYWDGTNGSNVLVITRADGTKQTIPPGNLTVNGLANGVTYYFLPFWAPLNGNTGWTKGTVGSPQVAMVVADTTNPVTSPLYLMQQSAQQHEPLTGGFMTATTGGSGSGGGGGGRCVIKGTQIVTLGKSPFALEESFENRWVTITLQDGRHLTCTYDHPLFTSQNGRCEADHIAAGDLMLTDTGECKVISVVFNDVQPAQKVCVRMEYGHLFYANGFLSHNLKPQG